MEADGMISGNIVGSMPAFCIASVSKMSFSLSKIPRLAALEGSINGVLFPESFITA